MARKRKDELEQAIEGALAPGAFVRYRDNGDFVDDVEAVRARIALFCDRIRARKRWDRGTGRGRTS